MSEGIEAVLDAYVAAWNEADADARRRLLEQAVADDCSFSGPLGSMSGREALDGQIVEAREFLPGATVVRLGPAELDHGIRFRWRIQSASGTTLAEGVDVVVLAADRRLASITVVPG